LPINDPGAKSFSQGWTERAKKEKNQKRKKGSGLMEMTPLWKSAPNADSHSGLEKPRQERSAFPHFHRPDDKIKTTEKTFGNTFAELDAHNYGNGKLQAYASRIRAYLANSSDDEVHCSTGCQENMSCLALWRSLFQCFPIFVAREIGL